MEDLFYRKEKKRRKAVDAILKLVKNKRITVRLVLGLLVGGYVLFGSHGVLQRLRLQYEKQELEQMIKDAEAETKRLQAESKALDGNPKAIEKVAREKYGMIREGETVYKVNKR